MSAALRPGTKVLTLTEPWATLVAGGVKTWETRSWQTPHRGWLAIHAARRFRVKERRLCYAEPFFGALHGTLGLSLRPDDDLVATLGCIIALGWLDTVAPTQEVLGACLVGVESADWAFGDWSAGRWAWRLRGVERLQPPVAALGSLGLWTYAGEERA